MSDCAKRKHATRRSAWKHIEYRRRQAGPGGGLDYTVYPCGDHFHIGHSQSKLGYRIREAKRRAND